MEAKKKINGVYAPDKETRKERIIVGLSGGIDSMVAAFLLKIQKYELFAVTVVPGWDQFTGNKAKVLACQVGDEKLESIKEFCNQLKIPLHIIRGNSEFMENVIEEWMGAKLTGTTSNACWNCHELRMELLYQKMVELDAKSIATGHYAKLFHHTGNNTHYVHTSNDDDHDQSALLNRLPSRVLNSLMLPLSDLQKKEVLKLAENFGLEVQGNQVKMHNCFPVNEELNAYLVERVPKKMAAPGEMFSEDGSEMFGSHLGVIYYDYGDVIPREGITKGQDMFFSNFSRKSKNIILKGEDHFMHNSIQLFDCDYASEVTWVEPMKAVIELSDNNYVECWIHPKSLSCVFVEWEGQHKVKAGEMLAIYKKKGKNAKVYLTGKARFLKKAPVLESEEAPVDHSRDF